MNKGAREPTELSGRDALRVKHLLNLTGDLLACDVLALLCVDTHHGAFVIMMPGLERQIVRVFSEIDWANLTAMVDEYTP